MVSVDFSEADQVVMAAFILALNAGCNLRHVHSHREVGGQAFDDAVDVVDEVYVVGMVPVDVHQASGFLWPCSSYLVPSGSQVSHQHSSEFIGGWTKPAEGD